MNEEQFDKWFLRIKNIMLQDGESAGFIEHALMFFEGWKGRDEYKLIYNFHPTLKGETEEVIYEFIRNSRYSIKGVSEHFRLLQMMDSAFFLYRGLLKLEYLHRIKVI